MSNIRTAIYSGSFAPPTNGHLDIIERASKLFDRVIVAVVVNPDKKPLFPVETRLDMLRRITAHLDTVEVVSGTGLLVDLAVQYGADVILRGIRGTADTEYELQMAAANKALSGIETVFLPASPAYSFISSSIVNACAMHGGDIHSMVPETILKDIESVHSAKAKGELDQ